RHGPAVDAVIDDLLHAGRVQDRDHHVDEVELGLVRGGRRFGRVVVAHQGKHAAMLRRAGEIGVAQRVARAVDARALAVPHADSTDEPPFPALLRLLRPPQRGCGKILVKGGLEENVVRLAQGVGALELVVEPAERRAAIARDIAGRSEPGAAVPPLLPPAHAPPRPGAGGETAWRRPARFFAWGVTRLSAESWGAEAFCAGSLSTMAWSCRRFPPPVRMRSHVPSI